MTEVLLRKIVFTQRLLRKQRKVVFTQRLLRKLLPAKKYWKSMDKNGLCSQSKE